MTARLFYEDAYLKTCEAQVVRSDERGIVLDRTVFYPLGGGQPADVGSIRTRDGRTFGVSDVRKGAAAGEILHLAPGAMLQQGEGVVVDIDWDKRHRHMRMHTCLHLLSAVIPAGVTGGSVRYDSGRLDFDLPDQALDRGRIEEDLNELVAGGHPVTARWVSEEELAGRPDLVKTMSVKPPMGAGQVRLLQIGQVDLQACGGTHVSNTAEIGRIQVVKVENKGAHNRRVTLAFASDP